MEETKTEEVKTKRAYNRRLTTDDNDKNFRAPVGQENALKGMSKDDKVRLATGRQARLDASFYAALPEYADKTLFWENDTDGQVEKWLHLGAELVPRRSKSLKHFKGFTDRAESEWECKPVGGDGNGGQLVAYLMVMDAEEYNELRIAPKEQRNKEILHALGIGKSQNDTPIMPSVKGLKTYAPELPTGGKGYEEVHDV